MSDSEDDTSPAMSTDEEHSEEENEEEEGEEEVAEESSDDVPGASTDEEGEVEEEESEEERERTGYQIESEESSDDHPASDTDEEHDKFSDDSEEEEKPKKKKAKQAKPQKKAAAPPAPTKVPLTKVEEEKLKSLDAEKKKHALRFATAFTDAIFGEESLKNQKVNELSHTFAEFAVQIAPLIITEKDFQPHLKKFEQASMGGTAGGDKFVAHGILFKYSLDTIPDPSKDWVDEASLQGKRPYLYGMTRRRNDLAMKAAGHEMLGLTHLMCTEYLILEPDNSKAFRFPLEVIIDHLSYRLTAATMLPLGRGSLLYGSGDAGKTVAWEPVVHEKMCDISKKLHLQEHIVADKKVAMCGDLEGHKGTDGFYYVLDTARVFPPSYPPSHYPNYVFSRMLRPELLHYFNIETGKELSSDGFTGFQQNDPNKNKYNVDLREATNYLCAVQVQRFAEELLNNKNITKGYIAASVEYASPKTAQFFSRRYTDPIIRRLHEFGINIRYLHLVRNRLPETERPETTSNALDDTPSKGPDDGRLLEEFLLSLMVCRILKNHWRVQCQDALNKSSSKTPSDVVKTVSSRILTEFCQNANITNVNVESGKKETGPFWDVVIKTGLFRVHGENYLRPGEELNMKKVQMRFVLVRMCQICGVFLTRAALDNIAYCTTEELFFTVLDIREIIPKLKFPAILDYYSGLYLLDQAQIKRSEGDFMERKKLMAEAEEKLAAAYSSYTQEKMGYAFAKALYGGKVINPKLFYDLRFSCQRFTEFLKQWVIDNKTLLDKIDPYRSEEYKKYTLELEVETDDKKKIQLRQRELLENLTERERAKLKQYWETLMMFVCSILFQIKDKEKKNETLSTLLERVRPKNFPSKPKDDTTGSENQSFLLYPAKILRKVKDSDTGNEESMKYKVVHFNYESLFTREGYLEIYTFGGPELLRTALEDLASFPYHGKREILQTFLDKLPIGGKDFCEEDCQIKVEAGSDHPRHRPEPKFRCEIDCTKDHAHNLCDFYCCIAYAENQTSRSEQYVFYEKAQSLSKAKEDDRFLQYIKQLQHAAPVILREAMQGGKSEAKRLQDFQQKCGTIALMYTHETHVDYAAVISTIPVTVWSKENENFRQNMIGWHTTEKEEPESWFFYLQRLLRFNPVDSTRIRFHAYLPNKFVVNRKKKTHIKQEVIEISNWTTDILGVRIQFLRSKYNETVDLKEHYVKEIADRAPKLVELELENKETREHLKKKLSAEALDAKDEDDLPTIKKLKEYEEQREAKKNFLAFRYEFQTLPRIKITHLDAELQEIDLEIKSLRKQRAKMESKPLTFSTEEEKALAEFERKRAKERSRFDQEMKVSTEGSGHKDFSDEERIMLSDVEYGVMNAISLGVWSDLQTIPEIDLFGNKKKKWDAREKEKAALDEKTDKAKITEIDDYFKKRKGRHVAKYKKQTPVNEMTEYIRIKIEKSTIPREYFFTLSFHDSCRIPEKYDDEAEFSKEGDNLPLEGLSLRTFVKRKFFENNTAKFHHAFDPATYDAPAKKDEPTPETKTEKEKPQFTPEELQKIEENTKAKLHRFCANKCADKLEDYVFRGPFFQHIKDASFAQCSATGYDWLMLDCFNTVEFVPHVLKCELIIYLGCGNDDARAYWKSRGRKFYHFVKEYMDRVISELKRNEDKPDQRDFVKGWLKGFILLVQYALFGYTETFDIFYRILDENILAREPLYKRALIDVFLASWGLVEFLRDPLQDMVNQLGSQTSKWEYDKLKLPKTEPGKGILVKPPRSYWQEVMSGRMSWERLKVELGHIFNILKGYKPHPVPNNEKYETPDKKDLFLISTNWKKTIANRQKKENEVALEGKERNEEAEKKKEEERKKHQKKTEWARIISESPLFEATDGGEDDADASSTNDIVRSSLPEDSPLLKEETVWQFFQAKVKKDPLDPERKILTDELMTYENFKNDLSSTEKAQKALKFISQFESVLNVMHSILSMNEERNEIFEMIMKDWNSKEEVTEVNQSLQRALIDCIVDLSIFPEGRKFFQKMLTHLSKQVSKEAETPDKS